MKVHTSNYAVQGFTSTVSERALAPLAHAHGVPLATDLGSGSLIDLSAYGLPREPLVQEMIAAGCDVVTFSGDKLLGGPQAGLIVGTKAAVERIRRFPMKRALRVSKLPLAALEATLSLYLKPERLAQDLPTLRLLTRPLDAIRAQAIALAPQVAAAVAPRFDVHVVESMGLIGSAPCRSSVCRRRGWRLRRRVSASAGWGLRSIRWRARCAGCRRPSSGALPTTDWCWICAVWKTHLC